MILRTSGGRDYLAFHWPNTTPDERVRLPESGYRRGRIRFL